MTARLRRLLARPHWAVPLVAVAVLLVLDRIHQSGPWPLVVEGALDEPAHLLTAWLALAALPGDLLATSTGRAALVAAVLIDVDHVPLYLTDSGFAVDGGRPPTHSLALAAALAAAAAAVPHRRRLLLGAALGVLLHFVRDLATGPGVPLLWPVADTAARVPHDAYLVAVLLLAAAAAVRSRARGTRLRSGAT
ncbi:metal-dependent hydrolase [Blastococcus xanthinilyticus]|uniref:Inner membrane protein n=1 Tax=Blastococcus xanthinilyticus TaxID=1564164 RepID=A0A5S5CWI9_9ACTN|nr:metal-dependent hydrolase [Blastococcus xanthinilyticus]TYP87206.1 inner membrane protein [Blastococcus xanthinilyticus]